MEKIQLLNYSNHAIEDIEELKNFFKKNNLKKSLRNLEILIDLLKNSIKFILPNCAELIDPLHIKQENLDLVKLPYPVVSFEVPWVKELLEAEVKKNLQPSSKRIALCWEHTKNNQDIPLLSLSPLIEHYLKKDGGIFVAPIYYDDNTKKWNVGFGGSFFPYEQHMRKLSEEIEKEQLPSSKLLFEKKKEMGYELGDKIFNLEPFVIFPEFYEQALNLTKNQAEVLSEIMFNSSDEVFTLISACTVLNCENIITTKIKAPENLNKKRIKNKKIPFFDTHIIELKSERKNYKNNINEEFNRKHASPRTHLRRGHIRRLENKTTWVRPTIVNVDIDNKINVTYKINK